MGQGNILGVSFSVQPKVNMLGPMGERGFNSKICCQASVQVRRFRASGIRSGKPEGFMNSNPTRPKHRRPCRVGAMRFVGKIRGKIVYFSTFLLKGELEYLGNRLSHPLVLAAMHEPGQGSPLASLESTLN